MLDQVASMFDDYQSRLSFTTHKKKAYDRMLSEFRELYGRYFAEMTRIVGSREDKDAAAQEIADCIVDAVWDRYQKWGRVSSRKRVDLGFYMIYYVFPSLLLTNHEDAVTIADHLRDTWNRRMKENITYADYESIRGSFHDKILGLIKIEDD